MDSARDISDSTDWLPTAIPLFEPFESSLRCKVCKDVYDTPMITSCAHTFCSLCIQRCLSSDGRCPACREQDQPSKLRKNWAVQEIVELFTKARPQALQLAQEYKKAQERLESGSTAAVEGASRPKRKWVNIEDEEEAARSQKTARQTRSRTRRTAEIGSSQEVIEVDDAADGTYVPDGGQPAQPRAPEDGLAECPICRSRMKAEAVWSHIENCDGTPAPRQSTTTIPQPKMGLQASQQQKSSITRLSVPNFALLKDGPLRKKIADMGIPHWGDRQLLIRRCNEWVNLYNANADSSRPRSNRELKGELDVWERSQGGHAYHAVPKAREKDFDGKAWAHSNKDQFDNLIAAARAKRKKAAPSAAGTNEEVVQADEAMGTANVANSGSIVKAGTDALPSATLNASADPLIPRMEMTNGSVGGGQSSPPQPQSHPTPVNRDDSAPAPPQTALTLENHEAAEKKPMFDLPAKAFYDGDGLGNSAQ